MRQLFHALSAVLALLAIALVSALVTMRIAIHGAEVRVPALTGLSLAQAAARLHDAGLETGVDGRFYSTIQSAGHVLTQSPAPGMLVRKSWRVRITVSLGRQKVAIPPLEGMDENIAGTTIQRSGLQLGDVGVLPYDYAPENTVIAQTPLARSTDAQGPRVSLLTARPSLQQLQFSVMPDLTGEPLTAAMGTILHAGFQLAPLTHPQTNPSSNSTKNSSIDPAGASSPGAVPNQAMTAPQPAANSDGNAAAALAAAPPGTVLSQIPAAGSRIASGAMIHLTVQP